MFHCCVRLPECRWPTPLFFHGFLGAHFWLMAHTWKDSNWLVVEPPGSFAGDPNGVGRHLDRENGHP